MLSSGIKEELVELRANVKLILVFISWIKSARVLMEHVWNPTLMPAAFGLQEQFDEGGVE